jgi:hypothetical protein
MSAEDDKTIALLATDDGHVTLPLCVKRLDTKRHTVTTAIMSWISNMEGKPDPNFKDDDPKVPDPVIPNRMVSTKRANRPFLA